MTPEESGPEREGDETTSRGLRIALWGVLLVVVLGLAFAALRSLTADLETARIPELPILGEIPDFELINRDGRTVGSSDLSGAPWVADFVFTRCPATCPRLSTQMKALQKRLHDRPEVKLVSISVDPEFDRPEVLEAYSKRFQAEDRWLFLTGESDAIYPLVRDGFKLVVDPSPRERDPDELIVHSTRFVLVDGAGQVRGYYDAFDPDARDRLLVDLERLGDS